MAKKRNFRGLPGRRGGNPFMEGMKMAAVEAKKADIHVEIDTMAYIISNNRTYGIGAGRIGDGLAEYLSVKMEIAKAITDELDDIQVGKKELVKVRRDLAVEIKRILGRENWDKYKTLLPFLREYWEW